VVASQVPNIAAVVASESMKTLVAHCAFSYSRAKLEHPCDTPSPFSRLFPLPTSYLAIFEGPTTMQANQQSLLNIPKMEVQF